MRPPDAPQPPRSPAVDALRGAAVVAMVIYHAAWDLSHLQLIETDVARSTAWSLFARAIAASFLLLVGFGLVLAHGAGLRRAAFVRRLVLLAAAALAVTAATAFVFPDRYVFFGILHNIALSSLLAVPFLRAPIGAVILGAIAFAALPALVALPVFDEGPLVMLGLGIRLPDTNDYVPVFPWTGFVLGGVALARAAGPRLARPASRLTGRVQRGLAVVGRHSLAIYLLHQPILFGGLSALVSVVGPNPAAVAAPYLRSCQASCRAAGSDEARCRTSCSCTVEAWRRDGVWDRLTRSDPGPADLARAAELARNCRAVREGST